MGQAAGILRTHQLASALRPAAQRSAATLSDTTTRLRAQWWPCIVTYDPDHGQFMKTDTGRKSAAKTAAKEAVHVQVRARACAQPSAE